MDSQNCLGWRKPYRLSCSNPCPGQGQTGAGRELCPGCWGGCWICEHLLPSPPRWLWVSFPITRLVPISSVLFCPKSHKCSLPEQLLHIFLQLCTGTNGTACIIQRGSNPQISELSLVLPKSEIVQSWVMAWLSWRGSEHRNKLKVGALRSSWIHLQHGWMWTTEVQ